jgi:hypothetical protein
MEGYEKKFVTIVSGLPRSGTSMMMRMLEAGGLPVITDSIRAADLDNPHGYFEFEPVKQLSKDASWLDAACEKAVKIIYRLLYDLPRHHRYKVIFMTRNLTEIIASQKAMLQRLNRAGGELADQQLACAFQNDLEKIDVWLRSQNNFSVIYVRYDRVLYDAQRTVTEIGQFLGYRIDIGAMVNAIDRSLHRQRVTCGSVTPVKNESARCDVASFASGDI